LNAIYLIVNGSILIDNGKLNRTAFPVRPIRRDLAP